MPAAANPDEADVAVTRFPDLGEAERQHLVREHEGPCPEILTVVAPSVGNVASEQIALNHERKPQAVGPVETATAEEPRNADVPGQDVVLYHGFLGSRLRRR